MSDEVDSHATPECEEVTTASFSASYSQLLTNERGNLANADPLLLGDDGVSVRSEDDDGMEEDEIVNQDEIESSCLDDNYREISLSDDDENVQRFIHEAVLKLVELKGENGFSVKAFEERLR